jgi:protein-disulfide isomerase
MKSETKLFAIMGAIVALGAGFLVFNKDAAPQAPPSPSPTPAPLTEARFEDLVKGTRYFKGDATARITVIEFADFQCPSCRFSYEKGVKLLGTLPNTRFGFRHFPLEEPHPFAKPAAIASELAGRQGKFWEAYTNLMKGEKEELSDDFIMDAIKNSGVDMVRFDKERGDNAVHTLIDKERETGLAAGVSQTPTFFVHDKQTHTVKTITGYRSLVDALKGIVELPPPPEAKMAKPEVKPPST